MFAPLLRTCVLATGLYGCATIKPTPSEAELIKTVTSLRAQNTAYARKLEESENQVFVLRAELDLRRAGAPPPAAEPVAPTLPETKLEPGKETPQPEAREGPTSLVDETEVEFGGAAAEERPGKRPMLRLWGSDASQDNVLVEEAPVRPTRGAAAAPARAVEGGEVALYQSALGSLRAGAYDDAVSGFRAFVKRHPGNEYADNAQYWLGECFYHRKDYPAAVSEFRKVVQSFPRGNKVPDARLKLGFSHLAQGNTQAGREALTELVRAYPQHPAAQLAAVKLAELDAQARADDRKEDR